MDDAIILDYHQGIETVIDFDGLDDFMIQDKTFLIDENYSNLFLYLNHTGTDFAEGYSDIYYNGLEEDIFLKRIYHDGPDSVMISIGGLIQKFVDKEIDYEGIKLKIGSGGYDLNTLNFHRYSEDPNSIMLNPRIEFMYSRRCGLLKLYYVFHCCILHICLCMDLEIMLKMITSGHPLLPSLLIFLLKTISLQYG